MAEAPSLHVEAEGLGESLILGHGFGGSARNFRAQSRALAARWHVVRFDARGHARSGAPREAAAYTPAALVDDVLRIVEMQSADRAAPAIVGGLSMGAGIALRFALAHPMRTRALVLAAFPASADTPGGYASIAERFADRIERDGLEAAGAEFVWGPSSGLDANGADLVRRGFLEHQPYALAHLLRGVIAVQPKVADFERELAAVRIPTLVIVGTKDRLSLASSRAVADAIPNAVLVEIPDAGHLVNLARPKAFNAAVAAFLDALPPR